MRAVVIVLLVANLLLLAWQFLGPQPEPPPRSAPLAASPLVLLAELPAMPQPPAEPASEAPPALPSDTETVGPPECLALGPYLDRDVAMAARERLGAAGITAVPRAVDASQRLGYWVFTPPAESRSDADDVVDRLRRAGVRDFYVVADGIYQHAVSLGVFSQEDTAERHAERLRALGFVVEVGERRREITAWWLDFAEPEADSPGATRVAELLRSGQEALLLQPRACE